MNLHEFVPCYNKCCCLITTMKIVKEPLEYLTDDSVKSKSGIVVIDSDNKILISQSYNHCWGIPKGSMEPHENCREASIRETLEETGLDLSEYMHASKLHVFVFFNNVHAIFFIKLNKKGPKVSHPSFLNTESTGCGWININCLQYLYMKKRIKVNRITKLIINKILFNKILL